MHKRSSQRKCVCGVCLNAGDWCCCSIQISGLISQFKIIHELKNWSLAKELENKLINTFTSVFTVTKPRFRTRQVQEAYFENSFFKKKVSSTQQCPQAHHSHRLCIFPPDRTTPPPPLPRTLITVFGCNQINQKNLIIKPWRDQKRNYYCLAPKNIIQPIVCFSK